MAAKRKMNGQMNGNGRKRAKEQKNRVPVPPKKRKPLPTKNSPLKQFKNGTKRRNA